MGVLNELLLRTDVLTIQMVFTVILDIAIIVFFLQKTSRDERGKSIIGSASIVSTIYFIIMMTVISQYMGRYAMDTDNVINIYIVANLIHFVYNTVILIEIVGIMVLRKIR